MDPTVEHLHRLYEEQRASSVQRREVLVETGAALLLALTCAVLALATDWSPPALPVAIAFVALYAAFWQVTFKVASVGTSPVQLLFVPMWFAVDPAVLPVIVAAGAVTGNLATSLRTRENPRWDRALLGIPDAWHAVGPAVVLAAAGVSAASSPAPWWIYVAALVAQFGVDLATTAARSVLITGVAPVELRDVRWYWLIDASLTPIGVVIALSLDESALALFAAAPLAGLFAIFAKEREDRIRNALELSSAYRGTARLMGDVLEADDAYTGGEHTQGVVEFSLAIGRELGLTPLQLRTLEFGAMLHDIGKLRVPNEIINKPGKLSPEEWEIIKLHPGYGQEMLDRVGGELSHAGRVVRAHHERWDGAGYPDGLAGEEIPIEARIITVCDSFSAMTTDRSYRKGMSAAEALVELQRCAGTQFDPQIVAIAGTIFAATAGPSTLRVVGAHEAA